MATVGERIKKLRTEKGMSQIELGREMGIGQGAISHIENNRRLPSFDGVIWLAKFFGVTLQFLIGNDVAAIALGPSYKDLHPEKYAAHVAVNKAITRGELLPARTHKCAHCEKQAQQWHHPSYLPEQHLHVTPLCYACHKRVHSSAALAPIS